MRIEQLTFFRFIAAAIVVIFHYGKEATGLSGALVSGPQMVTFFFVLSGFVMGVSYFNKEVSNSAYWRARVFRIMPVYLIALFLVVIAYVVSRRNVDITSLLLSLTLLQSWLPPYPTSLNTPGWSLSVEAFFYLAFPFVLLMIKKKKYTSIKLIIASIFFWLITQSITTFMLSYGNFGEINSTSYDLIYYFPITHLCSFLLGIAGGVYFLENESRVRLSWLPPFFALICIVVVLNNASLIREVTDLSFAFGSSFYAPLFLFFILMMSFSRSCAIKILCSPSLVLLGEASYSLYILQKPIHAIYETYVYRPLSFLPEVVNFTLFFALLTTISIFVFIYLEKPLNIFLRNKFAN